MAILGVILVTAIAAAPVMAARKVASADTGVIRAFDITSGDVWESVGHFTSEWDKTFLHEDGTTFWQFSYVHMWGGIEVYGQCPFHLCGGDAFVFGATFLNANGATVSSFSNFPIGSCGRSTASPPSWGAWDRCKANFSVPYSATQIRFNWLITESPVGGGPIAWQRSKTVPI